ncbi:MAG: hypothetical protein EBS19_05890 [Spirochaetia bacterium]|nr:hypothetical protein [Spirochaetia bacterium]
MAEIYPAGTESIRNLTPTFNYFLVVKDDSMAYNIPQKEYFVYRFEVPVNKKDGISQLNEYFKFVASSLVYECRELSDLEYATGDFYHPDYTNSSKQPLRFKMREIPIYIQSQIRVIDLEKDLYQYGSKPIIRDRTSVILDNN